jgi:hypothetical protein
MDVNVAWLTFTEMLSVPRQLDASVTVTWYACALLAVIVIVLVVAPVLQL